MVNYFRKLILVLCFLNLVHLGCGQGESLQTASTGFARLTVYTHKSGVSEASYSDLTKYLVEITGEGIGEPIRVNIDGAFENALIEGIPVGNNREIKVLAYNPFDKVIREGEKEGIKISSDKISEVEIDLQAVPIFANLYDGSVVQSDRMRIDLFSDPDDILEVQDLSKELPAVLRNLSTEESELVSDDKGNTYLYPVGLSEGEHVLQVKSKNTGRSSKITITVVKSRSNQPAAFYSAGFVYARGQYLNVSRVGTFAHAENGSRQTWTDVVSMVLERD